MASLPPESAVGIEPTVSAPDDDATTVEALRRGDEAAFCALIARYQRTLLNLALLYVPDRGAAEDVVQETWLAVIKGIDRFEGRSSLKTWLCRIATNRAKTRGERDHRMIAFSQLWTEDDDAPEPAVDPARFRPDGPYQGHWATRPEDWAPLPESYLLSRETQAHLKRAIDALPANQRLVLVLRDVEGWASEEVCQSLEISEVNQRVLLHRARSKVRAALERYLHEERRS